jgi:hypothetical protein
MSQHGNEEKHDEVQHQLADFLWENIPNMEALLIITRDGNVIEHRTVPQHEKVFTIEWLKNFGNLISVRFPTGDFHKLLGGLDMTINIFKDRAVLVSPLRTNHILTMIMPRTTNFNRLGSILSKFKRN